jgi:hypothetical protein
MFLYLGSHGFISVGLLNCLDSKNEGTTILRLQRVRYVTIRRSVASNLSRDSNRAHYIACVSWDSDGDGLEDYCPGCVTYCSFVDRCWRFGGICCLYLHSAMNVEVALAVETFVCVYPTTEVCSSFATMIFYNRSVVTVLRICPFSRTDWLRFQLCPFDYFIVIWAVFPSPIISLCSSHHKSQDTFNAAEYWTFLGTYEYGIGKFLYRPKVAPITA